MAFIILQSGVKYGKNAQNPQLHVTLFFVNVLLKIWLLFVCLSVFFFVLVSNQGVLSICKWDANGQER